jgi:hypothetical protein
MKLNGPQPADSFCELVATTWSQSQVEGFRVSAMDRVLRTLGRHFRIVGCTSSCGGAEAILNWNSICFDLICVDRSLKGTTREKLWFSRVTAHPIAEQHKKQFFQFT